MKKNMKKIMALLLTVTLSLGLYGCGSKNDKTESGTSTAAESDTSAAATDGSEKKTLVIGDTTFNPSNEELDVNPHNSYSGWACIRYGIGETLVKYSDDMFNVCRSLPGFSSEKKGIETVSYTHLTLPTIA